MPSLFDEQSRMGACCSSVEMAISPVAVGLAKVRLKEIRDAFDALDKNGQPLPLCSARVALFPIAFPTARQAMASSASRRCVRRLPDLTEITTTS